MKHFSAHTSIGILAMSISLLAAASTAKATTISILSPGDNRVTLYTDATTGTLQSVDVRGQAFLSVTTAGADVTLVDDLTGANNSAFPNAELFALNTGVTQGMAIFLNFGAATLGPTTLVVPVVVAPLTVITDPNLAALTSLRSLTYYLAIGPVTQGNSVLYQYDLAAITAVPEPAFLGLGGLLVLLGLGRLRTRTRVQ